MFPSPIQARGGICVWVGSYRVCPAPLPYQGKLLVHEGTSLCSLIAMVHHGSGPTPWHSLTLTGLRQMSLWLLSSLANFLDWGSLALLGFVSCSPLTSPLIITLISAQYMYYLRSQQAD
jgi:hypothetical protein